MEDLGKRLGSLRKEKKMSQHNVADVLFVTQQAVSRWETGKTKPNAKRIAELSKIYGVDASEILEGKKTEKNKLSKMSIVYLATSIFMIGFSAFAVADVLINKTFTVSTIFVIVAFLFCMFIFGCEVVKTKDTKIKSEKGKSKNKEK